MANDRLSKKLGQIDEEMGILLTRLGNLEHKIINTSPKEGDWSVTQILNHIKLAEFYAHSYVQKKINAKDLKKAGLGSKMRLLALKIYIGSPLTFDAPKAVNTSSLPVEDSIENIRILWENQRKSLALFFDTLSEGQKALLVYKHPAAGRMSLFDMLGFFESHFNHHKKQIDRTLKTVQNIG